MRVLDGVLHQRTGTEWRRASGALSRLSLPGPETTFRRLTGGTASAEPNAFRGRVPMSARRAEGSTAPRSGARSPWSPPMGAWPSSSASTTHVRTSRAADVGCGRHRRERTTLTAARRPPSRKRAGRLGSEERQEASDLTCLPQQQASAQPSSAYSSHTHAGVDAPRRRAR